MVWSRRQYITLPVHADNPYSVICLPRFLSPSIVQYYLLFWIIHVLQSFCLFICLYFSIQFITVYMALTLVTLAAYSLSKLQCLCSCKYLCVKLILMHFVSVRLFTYLFVNRVHNFLACFVLGKMSCVMTRYDALPNGKHLLLTVRQGIIFQKSWIYVNPGVRTSNLAR